ncbi:hypothetical protein ACFL96_18360 [Thermoproteota archaeon]
MSPYFIALIILLIIGVVGLTIYFYFIKGKKKGSIVDDYIWVGSGEHPFKKNKQEKDD